MITILDRLRDAVSVALEDEIVIAGGPPRRPDDRTLKRGSRG